jgi:hypothetical protein
MPLGAVVGGALGAAGSIGGALIGSSASKTASQQQADAQKAALAQQMQMFNTGKAALDPFISGGQSVLPTLQGLLTPGTSYDTLAKMPGFAFASQYGTKSATNALASKGQGMSAGPLATAVSQFNNGLAQNTWQNTVNALQGYANLGANSAGNLAGGAISSGNAQAGTIGNIGNALASGTLGSANALSGGLTGAAGGVTNALLYQQLFKNGGFNSGSGGGGIYDFGPSAGPTTVGGPNGPTPFN